MMPPISHQFVPGSGVGTGVGVGIGSGVGAGSGSGTGTGVGSDGVIGGNGLPIVKLPKRRSILTS